MKQGMPDKKVFEYAVIRIVPRIEREEFINVGVILFCKATRYLACTWSIDEERLQAFAPGLDIEEVRGHLEALERIAAGVKLGGALALLDAPSRFRWLTATRSTIVQTSKVHPGLCSEPEQSLQRLFASLAS
ncbi:MAG TPA: DUF3037 domain-containing protein [Flavisolibacter sp.]